MFGSEQHSLARRVLAPIVELPHGSATQSGGKRCRIAHICLLRGLYTHHAAHGVSLGITGSLHLAAPRPRGRSTTGTRRGGPLLLRVLPLDCVDGLGLEPENRATLLVEKVDELADCREATCLDRPAACSSPAAVNLVDDVRCHPSPPISCPTIGHQPVTSLARSGTNPLPSERTRSRSTPKGAA